MQPQDALAVCQSTVDGQEIIVTLASGRVFRGFFMPTSHPETFLYFDTLNSGELKAEWSKVESVKSPAGIAAISGSIMVPPEHPLSGVGPTGPQPYTVRNPR